MFVFCKVVSMHNCSTIHRQYAFIFMSTGCVEIHNLCFQDISLSLGLRRQRHTQRRPTHMTDENCLLDCVCVTPRGEKTLCLLILRSCYGFAHITTRLVIELGVLYGKMQ